MYHHAYPREQKFLDPTIESTKLGHHECQRQDVDEDGDKPIWFVIRQLPLKNDQKNQLKNGRSVKGAYIDESLSRDKDEFKDDRVPGRVK